MDAEEKIALFAVCTFGLPSLLLVGYKCGREQDWEGMITCLVFAIILVLVIPLLVITKKGANIESPLYLEP